MVNGKVHDNAYRNETIHIKAMNQSVDRLGIWKLSALSCLVAV